MEQQFVLVEIPVRTTVKLTVNRQNNGPLNQPL